MCVWHVYIYHVAYLCSIQKIEVCIVQTWHISAFWVAAIPFSAFWVAAIPLIDMKMKILQTGLHYHATSKLVDESESVLEDYFGVIRVCDPICEFVLVTNECSAFHLVDVSWATACKESMSTRFISIQCFPSLCTVKHNVCFVKSGCCMFGQPGRRSGVMQQCFWYLR